MIKIKFNDSVNLIECEFRRLQDNVVFVIGNNIPTNDFSGFLTFREDGETQLGDFSDYTTVYRIVEDGVQFSNDGSIWVEPQVSRTFEVEWHDNDDEKELRPNAISAVIVDELENEETLIISANNNWKHVFTYPEHKSYNLYSSENVDEYDYAISNDTIIYTLIQPETKTWQDEIEAQVLFTAVVTDTLLED